MADDSDRVARAGEYVLGVMSESDRLRAERDLEVDASFRDAVVEAAQRMHVFDRPATPAAADTGWAALKDRLAELPQMRPSAAPQPAVPPSVAPHPPLPLTVGLAAPPPRLEPDQPVTFGRRRSDFVRPTPQPAPPPAVAGKRTALLLAACLIAAFGLGYFTGVASVTRQPPVVTQP